MGGPLGRRVSGSWKGKLRREAARSKGLGGRGKARPAKVGMGRERKGDKGGGGGDVARSSILLHNPKVAQTHT